MTLFPEGVQTHTENCHKWRTQVPVMEKVFHRRKLWECLVVCFLFLEVRANSLHDEHSNGENDKVF
jgi:hypothetical protein